MRKGAAKVRADGFEGEVKILTSCPSCLQGLSRYDHDTGTTADYIVVEMARHLLGENWMPRVRRARPTAAASSASCCRLFAHGAACLTASPRGDMRAVAACAGCATRRRAPMPAPRRAGHADVAGAPIDLGAKFKMPDRERGRARRAAMNAQYHLEIEADENGPPTRRADLPRPRAAPRDRARDGARGAAEVRGPAALAVAVARARRNVGGRVRAIAFDPRNPDRLSRARPPGGLWISRGRRRLVAREPRLPAQPVDHHDRRSIRASPRRDVPRHRRGERGPGGRGRLQVDRRRRAPGATSPSTNADANPDWRFVNRLAVHPAQPQVLLAALTNNDLAARRDLPLAPTAAPRGRKVSRAARRSTSPSIPNNPANAVAGLDDGTHRLLARRGRSPGRAPRRSSPRPRGAATPRAPRSPSRARSRASSTPRSTTPRARCGAPTTAGATWTKLSTPEHLSSQGDYDNAIWVDPTDANHVIVGGLDLYQSRDGGATFTKVSDWRNAPASPHADHHALVSPPDFGAGEPALFNGNDGGVYTRRERHARRQRSAAGLEQRQQRPRGHAVLQRRGAHRRRRAHHRRHAGQRLAACSTQRPVAAVPRRRRRLRRGRPGTDQHVLRRVRATSRSTASTNGGASRTYICNGITEAHARRAARDLLRRERPRKANFIAPFILDPNNSQPPARAAPTRSGSPTTRAAARPRGARSRRPRRRPTTTSTRSPCTRATAT